MERFDQLMCVVFAIRMKGLRGMSGRDGVEAGPEMMDMSFWIGMKEKTGRVG